MRINLFVNKIPPYLIPIILLIGLLWLNGGAVLQASPKGELETIVTISGKVLLQNRTNFAGVKVVFYAQTPSGLTDSTLTDSTGAYSINIFTGVYRVLYRYGNYVPAIVPDTMYALAGKVSPVLTLLSSGAPLRSSGTLSRDTVYFASNTVIVPAGQTLTIPSGTKLAFFPGTGLQVFGTLLARGTVAPADTIVFTSLSGIYGLTNGTISGNWAGLRVTNGAVVFVKIEYAELGVQTQYADVTDSYIHHCTKGILGYQGLAKIYRNKVRYGQFGIHLWGTSHGVVDNTISNCSEVGILINSSLNNVISNHVDYCSFGIICEGDRAPKLSVNSIQYSAGTSRFLLDTYGINQLGGVGIFVTLPVMIKSNLVKGAGHFGIYDMGGSIIDSNTVRDQTSLPMDAAIYSHGGTVTHNRILFNNRIGIFYAGVPGSTAKITGNLVRYAASGTGAVNSSPAVFIDPAFPVNVIVTNNTIMRAMTPLSITSYFQSLSIKGNIFLFSQTPVTLGAGDYSKLTINYNDTYPASPGWVMPPTLPYFGRKVGTNTYGDSIDTYNNFSSYPQFADTLNLNFALLATSHCVDLGDPLSPKDPDGSIADIGAYPYAHPGAGGGTDMLGATTDNAPVEFALQQNYPNPFNPTTRISFSIPSTGNVSLAVYDMVGRKVANLVNGELPVGVHEIPFDGSGLASGMYCYRLQVTPRNSGERGYTSFRKMVLMK